jgi:hypothetical protein
MFIKNRRRILHPYPLGLDGDESADDALAMQSVSLSLQIPAIVNTKSGWLIVNTRQRCAERLEKRSVL